MQSFSISRVFIKIAFLFCVVPFLSQVAFSQTNSYLGQFRTNKADTTFKMHYWRAFLGSEKLYNCSDQAKPRQAVNATTFDSFLRPALSNVFVGSNDLTKNTTAAAFTQDDKTGTLNLNYAWLKNKQVLNVGAFSKSADGIFGIYSGNSWSSDVGVTFAYSFPLFAGLLYDGPDCEKLHAQRRGNMLPFFSRVDELTTYDTIKLKERKEALEKELSGLPNEPLAGTVAEEKLKQLHLIDSVLKLHNTLIKRLGDELAKRRNELTTKADKDTSFLTDEQRQNWIFWWVTEKTKDFVASRMDSIVSEWEVKQANIFTGYSIFWISPSLAVANNSITLSTDSLAPALKKDFKAKNLAKFLAGFSLNWQLNKKKDLYFLSLGLHYGLHNYLDHPSVKKPGIRVDETTQTFYVYNKNETLLATYDDLDANIYTWEPSFNFSWFHAAQKQVGLNIRTDFRLVNKIPDAIKSIYPSTFTLVTGPIFRLLKDKSVSQGTVGLDVGFVDAPIHSNVWDSFAFKFTIGVPFNALIK